MFFNNNLCDKSCSFPNKLSGISPSKCQRVLTTGFHNREHSLNTNAATAAITSTLMWLIRYRTV